MSSIRLPAVVVLIGILTCLVKVMMTSAYGQAGRTSVQAVDLSTEIAVPTTKRWKTVTVSSPRQVKSNLTIPSNVCLRFEDGGMCEVADGVTLTINGPLEAPLVQVFDGAGKVMFGSSRLEKVYPQWWGAQPDDDADDSAAIQAAIDAVAAGAAWTSGHAPPRGGIVFFPGGQYDISSRLKIYDGTTLEGTSHRTVIQVAKGVAAIVQRHDLTPPPSGIHFNIATRINGVRLANLILVGDGSGVGLDLTNISYATIEDVTIVGCKTGVLTGQLTMYCTVINPAIAHCETGIEINQGTMDNNIFGGRISAVDTGLLINNTGQLNLYGMTFDAYKSIAIDIRSGDSVNLHHPWFDSVEGSVVARFAQSVSSCTMVNPRYSGPTPKMIDNQSKSTVISDN